MWKGGTSESQGSIVPGHTPCRPQSLLGKGAGWQPALRSSDVDFWLGDADCGKESGRGMRVHFLGIELMVVGVCDLSVIPPSSLRRHMHVVGHLWSVGRKGAGDPGKEWTNKPWDPYPSNQINNSLFQPSPPQWAFPSSRQPLCDFYFPSKLHLWLSLGAGDTRVCSVIGLLCPPSPCWRWILPVHLYEALMSTWHWGSQAAVTTAPSPPCRKMFKKTPEQRGDPVEWRVFVGEWEGCRLEGGAAGGSREGRREGCDSLWKNWVVRL